MQRSWLAKLGLESLDLLRKGSWVLLGFVACGEVRGCAAAVLAAVVLGAPARAGFTVTATFDTVAPGEVVTITLGGQSETGWAGVYNFKNASGYSNGSSGGFCIDISQNIYSNVTATWNVTDLANAPTPGNQMGTLRANLIRELWYNDFGLSGSSNSNAAAFQLAIWEIENETTTNANGTLALNLSTGSFTATDSDAATITTANSWLSQLDLSGNGPKDNSLIALTNSTYQDYVTRGTPAPAGLVLASTGAVSVLLTGV
jgi:hypothetical protein